MIRICVCESQPIVVEGLRRILAENGEFELVGAVATARTAWDLMKSQKPRLCLLDQSLFAADIVEFLAAIRGQFPESETILWDTEMRQTDAYRALQAGVRGILNKTAPGEVILNCLRTVAYGNVWVEKSISNGLADFLRRPPGSLLTKRDREIVGLVAGGLGNKQIAEKICVTVGTVKVHLMHVFQKLGLESRFQLVLYGLEARKVLEHRTVKEFTFSVPLLEQNPASR